MITVVFMVDDIQLIMCDATSRKVQIRDKSVVDSVLVYMWSQLLGHTTVFEQMSNYLGKVTLCDNKYTHECFFVTVCVT